MRSPRPKALLDLEAFIRIRNSGASRVAHSGVDWLDVVGSTQLIKATHSATHKTFIVGTDRGIFYKMQQGAPDDN